MSGALVLGLFFVNVYSSGPSSSPAPAAGPSKSAPSSNVAVTPKEAAPPAKPAVPAGTVAQLQALAASEGYLNSGQGFSQAGLIAQLTSPSGSQFTQAQAQYAVAQVGLK